MTPTDLLDVATAAAPLPVVPMAISRDVITLLLAVVAACGASLVTGHYSKPKVKAEGFQAEAAGEVALSGDARAWAQLFAERAERAEARATAAEQRAAVAEQRARDAEEHAEDALTRCDDTDARFLKLANYTAALQTWAAGPRDAPRPPVPPELVPPLRPL